MPSPDRPIVITIDGPAASGKSSTARTVAAMLGFRQADSGALYRAATAARLRVGGEPFGWTEESVLEAAKAVSVLPVEQAFAVRIGGLAADDELRSSTVTTSVSLVARMPAVRAWVNARMRECAGVAPIVVDGRDMGTAVFPDALLKVWLDAATSERARRRSVEVLRRDPTAAELAKEAAELEFRDAKDAAQSRPAVDAVHIDTTRLTPDEQVARIVALARERIT